MFKLLKFWMILCIVASGISACGHTPRANKPAPVIESKTSHDNALVRFIVDINDLPLLKLQEEEQTLLQRLKLAPQEDVAHLKLALIYGLPASQLRDPIKSNAHLNQVSVEVISVTQQAIWQILRKLNQDVIKSNERLTQLKQQSKAASAKSNEDSKKAEQLQSKVDQLNQKNTQLQQQVKQLEQTIESLKRVEQQLIERP